MEAWESRWQVCHPQKPLAVSVKAYGSLEVQMAGLSSAETASPQKPLAVSVKAYGSLGVQMAGLSSAEAASPQKPLAVSVIESLIGLSESEMESLKE